MTDDVECKHCDKPIYWSEEWMRWIHRKSYRARCWGDLLNETNAYPKDVRK